AAKRVVHYHERRQILILSAQSIREPRSHARIAHAVLPGINLEQGRAVIVRLREAGMDEGHPIDVPGLLRKNLRDPGAAFAILLKRKWRSHQRADFFGEKSGVVVESLESLAVAFLKLRLIVPSVDLAGAAVEEDPDHGFGFRGKMPGMRSQGV